MKLITEHDVLKLLGTMATAILIPLLMWTFISLHNKLDALTSSVVDLHEQIAVLKVEFKKQHEYTAAEFDATKSQIRAAGAVVQGLRSDAGDLIKAVNAKTANIKAAKRR